MPNPKWSNKWIGGCCVKGNGNKPNLVFVGYADQTSMVNAAATDATDVTSDMTLFNVGQLQDLLKQHPGAFKIQNGATYNPEQLFFNVHNTPDGGKTVDVKDNTGNTVYSGKNPVANVNVRLALSLTFNRPKLIEYMYKVGSSIANKIYSYDEPVVNEKGVKNPYADKAITGVWDPIQKKFVAGGTSKALKDAVKLLGKAGYHGCSSSKTCLTVYLTTNGTGNTARGNAALFLASAFSKIGVKLNYVDVESGSHGPFLRTWSAGGTAAHGWYEIALFAYGQGLPQPDGWLQNVTTTYCAQKGQQDIDENYSCIEDKVIDHALNAASKTASDKARQSDFDKFQMEFAKQAYWVNTDVRPNITTYDSHAHNIIANPFDQSVPNWDANDWKAS
jgi:ABC-type oligopeptide transport system substrate-binding subunit